MSSLDVAMGPFNTNYMYNRERFLFGTFIGSLRVIDICGHHSPTYLSVSRSVDDGRAPKFSRSKYITRRCVTSVWLPVLPDIFRPVAMGRIFGTNAMTPMAAGAHLPAHWIFSLDLDC